LKTLTSSLRASIFPQSHNEVGKSISTARRVAFAFAFAFAFALTAGNGAHDESKARERSNAVKPSD
jgi:hypothetical protein